MKWLDNTALVIVIIGAVNWLLVGIFQFDLVAFLFGNLSWLFQNHLHSCRLVRTLSDQLFWQNREFSK